MSFDKDLLKSFFKSASLISMGLPILDSIDVEILEIHDGDTKIFFSELKSSWESLPLSEPLRLYPPFQKRELLSEDWKIFSSYSLYGEACGMLDVSWLYAASLLLLKKKLIQTKPESMDYSFVTSSIGFLDPALAPEINFRSWSNDKSWQSIDVDAISPTRKAYREWLCPNQLTSTLAEASLVQQKISQIGALTANPQMSKKVLNLLGSGLSATEHFYQS